MIFMSMTLVAMFSLRIASQLKNIQKEFSTRNTTTTKDFTAKSGETSYFLQKEELRILEIHRTK